MKKRFSLHHLLPGLSLVFTLFVFAPIDLYLAFREELWFPLTCMLRWIAVFGAASFLIITLLLFHGSWNQIQNLFDRHAVFL